MALKNNLQLQSQQLNVQSAEKMKRSVFDLPKTEFNLQYGQYNSLRNDLGLSLSQNIPFPTYFTAKSKLYEAELQSNRLKQEIYKSEIAAQIKALYYGYQYLMEQQRILRSLDSVYGNFVDAAKLRYTTGESNLLEKTTAETKRGQMILQLQQNENDMAMTYNSLKALLNAKEDFRIDIPEKFEPVALAVVPDTSQLNNNPSLKLFFQNAVVANQNRKVETSAVLPDFSVGYFNQSLTGYYSVNGQEVFFDRSKRFEGFNVGLAIPLTFFSNTSKINSLKLQQHSLNTEAENNKLQLQSQLQNAIKEYEQHLTQFNFYKTTALQNADTMIQTATLAYRSGDIGYMEYLQALQTATDIELNYLSAVNDVNQSVVKINYLLNK